MERERNLEAVESQSRNGKSKQVDDPEIEGPRSSFADLPDCIIIDIFLRLPMKGVLVCRRVCQSWRRLISDPEFAKLHFKHAQVEVLILTDNPKCVSRTLHLLDFEPEMFDEDGPFCSCDFESSPKLNCKSHMKLEAKFRLPWRDAKMALEKRIETESDIPCKPGDDKLGMVNSCNGLLCLGNRADENPLLVCNPVTGEFIKLPEPINFERREWPFLCGFGFHPRTDEYKVIRIYEKCCKWWEDGLVAEMHTLGTQAWRVVGKPPPFSFGPNFPACVNGALYWLIYDYDDVAMILSFSFDSELFQSFPCPEYHRFEIIHDIVLGEYRGCIYLMCYGNFGLEFWVKEDVAEPWTELFCISIEASIDFPPGFIPIKFYETDAVLMYHRSCNYLLYFKLGEFFGSDFKYFKIHGTQYKFEATPHIPSLLSLKDAVKNANAEVLNVVSRWGAFKQPEENEVLYLAQEYIKKKSLYTTSESESNEYNSE